MTDHDEYKKVETPAGMHIEHCPLCASSVELWRHSESLESRTETTVCCTNNEPIGPQDSELQDGCLLYMPPNEFYRATIREAVKYWNEFARAIDQQRRTRRWEAAKIVLNIEPSFEFQSNSTGES